MSETQRLIFRDPKLERQFAKAGYFKIPFCSSAKLQRVSEFYNQQNEDKPASGFHSTMMVDNSEYRKIIDEYLKLEFTSNIELLLKGYKILFGNYIVKEPGGESEVGVHQDWNYLDEEKYDSVNFWVPLSTVSKDQGRLHVLPGSHRLPTSIRYTPYEMPPWSALFNRIKELSVEIEVQPGEAVVYHPGLIHFSPNNTTDKPRIAAGLVCNPKEIAALHYFRNRQEDPQALEVFEVTPEFFHKMKIGDRPSTGATFKRKVDYDHFSFSADQLENLNKELKSGEGVFGFIKGLFGG